MDIEKISLWGAKIGGILIFLACITGLFFFRESLGNIIRYTIFGSVLLCFISFLTLAIARRKKEGALKKENFESTPVKRKRGTKEFIMLFGVFLMLGFAISMPFAYILAVITNEGGYGFLPLMVGIPTFPAGLIILLIGSFIPEKKDPTDVS